MIGLIDIGGTKLLVGIAGDDGTSVARSLRRDTPRSGDMVATLAGMLDEVSGGERLDAIAAAVPGPFDRASGALLNPPGLSGDWHRLELASPLKDRYSCAVVVENDANCAALAEARHGAGRDCSLVVYYTVSTGIGSGVVRDGRLETGRQDTEGGHQVLWPARAGGPPCDCGGAGCLEALASGRALERRFGRRAEEIEEQAVWDEVGEWLGLAAVNATALIDCNCIVFGGGVASSRWDRIQPALVATVDRHLRLQEPPRLRRAELGEDRNLVGALLLLDPAGRGPSH